MKDTVNLNSNIRRSWRYAIITLAALFIFLIPTVLTVSGQMRKSEKEANDLVYNSIKIRVDSINAAVDNVRVILNSVDEGLDKTKVKTARDLWDAFSREIIVEESGFPLVIAPSGEGFYKTRDSDETIEFDVFAVPQLRPALHGERRYVSDPFYLADDFGSCVIHKVTNGDLTLGYLAIFIEQKSSIFDLGKPVYPDNEIVVTDKAGRVLLSDENNTIKVGDVVGSAFYLSGDKAIGGVDAYAGEHKYFASIVAINAGEDAGLYYASLMDKAFLHQTILTKYRSVIIVLVLYNVFLIGLTLLWYYRVSLANKRLYRLAYVDETTNRTNKIGFGENFSQALKGRLDYVFISVEIATFRSFNDTFGFEKGDALLRLFANVIADNLYSGEYFCRENAGDFFLLLKYVDKDDVADRMAQMSRDLEVVKEKENIVSSTPLKYGAVRVDDRFLKYGSYVAYADYAKNFEEGNNFFEGNVKDSYNQTEYVRKNIDKAVAKNEMTIYLQGVYHLSRRGVRSAEALVRWRPKDSKIIYTPKQFIRVAEQSGAIVDIDLFAVEEACRLLARLKKARRPLIPISINFSEVTLFQRDILYRVNGIIGKYKVDASLIVLEIPEGIAEANAERFKRVAEQFHTLGLRLALDDFGSGHSAFSVFKELNVDVIKLSPRFLSADFQRTTNKILLKTIAGMAKELNITPIGVGVEFQTQSQLLKECGYEYGQGKLFGKPMSLYDFERYMADQQRRKRKISG